MIRSSVNFLSRKTGEWLRRISYEQRRIADGEYDGSNVSINICPDLTRHNITPVHVQSVPVGLPQENLFRG